MQSTETDRPQHFCRLTAQPQKAFAESAYISQGNRSVSPLPKLTFRYGTACMFVQKEFGKRHDVGLRCLRQFCASNGNRNRRAVYPIDRKSTRLNSSHLGI